MAETWKMSLHYEKQLIARNTKKKQLPVTLIGGELGSGKTTLVQHILQNRLGLKVVVIVNDFAAVNIDESLLKPSLNQTGNEQMIELSNGCVCCSLGKKFEDAIWENILNRDMNAQIDYLVVETSGVTDPSHLMEKLDKKFGRLARTRLDSVVNVIDTDSVLYRIDKQDSHGLHNVEVNIRCSDVVLLNKMDLVEKNEAERVCEWVRSIQSNITVYYTERCYLGLNQIMDVEEVREDAMLTHEARQGRLQVRGVGQTIRREKEKMKHHHTHHDLYQSYVFESQRPISIFRFEAFLHEMQTFSRVKGFVWFKEFGNVVWTFQISGRQRYHIEETKNHIGAPKCCLVFIGPWFDENMLKQKLKECHYDLPPGESNRAMSFMDSQTAFEVLEEFQTEDGVDETVMTQLSYGLWPFRLTASAQFGIPEHSIGAKGIDLNGTNHSIQKAVNMRGILMPGININNQYRLFFISGESNAHAVWKVLYEEANRVLFKTFGKLARCACDH